MYEVFGDASINPTRLESAYPTVALYETKKAYFYNKDKWPNGIIIKEKDDLKKYSNCQVRGFNHSDFGLSEKDVSLFANDMRSVFELLDLGRCDIFAVALEPTLGFAAIGEPFFGENFTYKTLDFLPRQSFHFHVCKKITKGERVGADNQ